MSKKRKRAVDIAHPQLTTAALQGEIQVMTLAFYSVAL
jgi:hypothetical protein